MSEASSSGARPRRRRADAERSRAAILRAATEVLGERQDAGLDDIADVAGVTRQTVYAHFSSRERLISAVADHVTAEVVATMDAVDTEAERSAETALVWLLDASRRAADRYPVILRSWPMDPEESHDLHRPIVERLTRVIRRGRHSHEFSDRLPLDWLVTAIIALSHAAGEEVSAGRMAADDAADALHHSVLRMLSADPGPRLGEGGPTDAV